MIIQLEEKIGEGQKKNILSALDAIGYKATEVRTQKGFYFVCIGKKEFDLRLIGSLPGVRDVHRVSEGYKLVSRKWKVGESAVDLGDGVLIGDGHFALMAGPCSIESEEQVTNL